ncbi:MAG TPA: cupredoxin family copper-binding protein [Caldimonas sp.]|jgi:plastocyanin
MPRRRAALVAAAVAASVAATLPSAAAQGSGRTHEIVIQGLRYVPETLKVRRGDVVVWTNKDPFPHTATAKGAFDSKPIAEGHSWRWTATRAGTFAYVCTLHSNMKGSLQVE